MYQLRTICTKIKFIFLYSRFENVLRVVFYHEYLSTRWGRLADLRFLIRYVTVFLQSRFSYLRNELPETFEAEVDGLADLERNQRSFRSCKWTPPYFLLWAFFVRCTDSLPFVRTNLCYVTSPIFKPNSAHETIFNCVNLKGIVSKYVPLSH